MNHKNLPRSQNLRPQKFGAIQYYQEQIIERATLGTIDNGILKGNGLL